MISSTVFVHQLCLNCLTAEDDAECWALVPDVAAGWKLDDTCKAHQHQGSHDHSDCALALHFRLDIENLSGKIHHLMLPETIMR